MDKAIWNSTEKWPYFLGNVLVGVRVVYLSHCSLVLSLLKNRGVGAFLNKKNEDPNRGSPLIVVCVYIYIYIYVYKNYL